MFALLALGTAQAYAAQVLDAEVTRDGARFLIRMHVAIDAAPSDVFRALRDYSDMPRYNPDLIAVRVQPTSQPNSVRLFTTVHTCVLLFCKTMQQQQLMTAVADASGGVLEAELVAEPGAFQGAARWNVYRCHDRRLRACIDMHMELVPLFWLPPVLGPWLIRSKMYEEAQRSSVGLEQVARSAPKT